jgi:hypothetical protein
MAGRGMVMISRLDGFWLSAGAKNDTWAFISGRK